MSPGAFVLLLRPGEEELEVLLQYRAKHLRDGQTWGLVGGQLDHDEWWIHDSQRVNEELRQRLLRRAALREALEEMGAVPPGVTMPLTPVVFEPLCVQISEDGKAMRLPRSVSRWPVPAGLSFLEMDAQRSRQLRVGKTHTYVFVYLIDALRDGEIFMGDQWQPREPKGGEVDQSKGVFGYQWRPLSNLNPEKDLQPWVAQLDWSLVQQLAEELRLPRPTPEISWRDGALQELQLLAMSFETQQQWRQCDQKGCSLKEWAQERDLLKSAVEYFQEEAPAAFNGAVWSAKPARVLRLCADAVQRLGWEKWEELRDAKKFTLKDWEAWDFKGDTAKQKWMKDRGQQLRHLLLQLPALPAVLPAPAALPAAPARRWKT